MGTTIKISIWKHKDTTADQWGKMIDYCLDTFEDVEENFNYIFINSEHCSYSSANLLGQYQVGEKNRLIFRMTGVEGGIPKTVECPE